MFILQLDFNACHHTPSQEKILYAEREPWSILPKKFMFVFYPDPLLSVNYSSDKQIRVMVFLGSTILRQHQNADPKKMCKIKKQARCIATRSLINFID